MPQPSERNGIYLGLPHHEYLADPALGSSSIKALCYDPAIYWFNAQADPAFAPETTPAQRLGSAIHCLALEGPEVFKTRYAAEPGPEFMRTVAEISDFVRAKGGKPSRLKAQLIEDALALDPAVKIYDIAIAAATEAGMTILKEDEWSRAITSAEAILANPYLAPAISGGRPEVSVFWSAEVDGVSIPLKVRFDYLKPRAIIDLKSISPAYGRDFGTECRRAIASWGYGIQAQLYLHGRAKFAGFWKAGLVHGLPEDDAQAAEWGSLCANAAEYAFVLVFAASTGVPLTWGCSLSPENPILTDYARPDAERALAAYARCVKQYSPGEPWLEYEPLAELDITEMPAFFGR